MRTARILASLVALAAAGACTSFLEVSVETPIQPKLDITPFSRVLVAGFVAGGTEDVDANLETVRMLRNQLKSKSSVKVIDADVLPLMEEAAKRPVATPDGSAVPAAESSGVKASASAM